MNIYYKVNWIVVAEIYINFKIFDQTFKFVFYGWVLIPHFKRVALINFSPLNFELKTQRKLTEATLLKDIIKI